MNSIKRLIISLLAAASLLNFGVVSAQEDELLPPEKAFALQAWIENNSLIAEFQIAPGYYMYRERFDFQVESSGARFDTAIIPDGKIKNDEFFGDMEVYRDSVRIELPIIYASTDTEYLRVKTSGQGCADIGVCYPPLQQSLDIDTTSTARVYPTAYQAPTESQADDNVQLLQALLGESTSSNELAVSSNLDIATESSSALSVLQLLGEESGLTDDDEIPHPDTAFMLSAELDADNNIQSEIIIYPNTYLYRDKTKVSLLDGTGHSLGAIYIPRGKEKTDEFLGDTEVFYDLLQVSIPVVSDAGASENYTLSYQYQGCVEDRICYPPITKYLKVNSDSGKILISDDRGATANTTASKSIQSEPSQNQKQPQSEQDVFTDLLKDVSLWSIVLFFLAGIGLTFTPCVFPMIPILSSIIAGQGESVTTRKAFSLSLVYVLSMASTYAVAGAIVGYYGAEFNIQVWFQDPVILSVFAAIFVLLALSMFGFYQIQMPLAIQNRIASISNSQQGGNLASVGIMGMFSAIIVGPCITAPLVGALIFISQTQDWLLGGIALFALGLGMGVPLLIVGTSAGNLLPRAGKWMDIVKSGFGVLLLGMAIWLLERILPVSIIMGLIAALLMTSAIYLGALDSLPESASGWRKLSKGAGVILLLYGAIYLVGAVSDSRDLLQPLRGVFTSNSSQSSVEGIQFRQIKGQQGLQQALSDSVGQNRATMLDFYADWCISCKEMERYAFTHPGVLKSLEQVNTIQADVTANDAIDIKLLSSLGIYGPPAILFFDPQGNEISHRRVVGEMSGEDFAAHILGTY